jgi:radical SAM superfamily enzyme YgiQ (UPF0313 family)
VNVLLISTYEMGRQPFGLASPAAWLRAAGAHVTCADLSQQALDQDAVRAADLVGFYLPMHTATRIAGAVIRRVGVINPGARICAYGLYAPLNADWLRQLGVAAIFGGEFEKALADYARELESGRAHPDRSPVSLERLDFLVPDRSGLPSLRQYARLVLPDGSRRVVGYTEASRGCKHLCRHCPIVPVYSGKFRIVQRDVVLEDVRRQIAAGAQHITFGDPDFFNGVTHAIELVSAMHREFPELTYDVTIKVEHLLEHASRLAVLRDTGCAFVTSAVESLDDRVLRILDKGHTRADFLRAVTLFRETGLALAPTFVAFMPWTTLESYSELLDTMAELGLVDHVAPVQWAIRLLIPSGSRLLETPEVQTYLGDFDDAALSYRWKHPDERMDTLQRTVERRVQALTRRDIDRQIIFDDVRQLTSRVAGDAAVANPGVLPALAPGTSRTTVPYLTEPWFC